MAIQTRVLRRPIRSGGMAGEDRPQDGADQGAGHGEAEPAALQVEDSLQVIRGARNHRRVKSEEQGPRQAQR